MKENHLLFRHDMLIRAQMDQLSVITYRIQELERNVNRNKSDIKLFSQFLALVQEKNKEIEGVEEE